MPSIFTGLKRTLCVIQDHITPDRSMFVSDLTFARAMGELGTIREVLQLASWAAQPTYGRDPSELWFPFDSRWRAWASLRTDANGTHPRLRVAIFVDRATRGILNAPMMGMETKTNCGATVDAFRKTSPAAIDGLNRTRALNGPKRQSTLWAYFPDDIPTGAWTPDQCVAIIMDTALDNTFSSPHTRVEGWLPANPYLLVHHFAHIFAPLMRDGLGWQAATSEADPPYIPRLPDDDRLKNPRPTQAGLDLLTDPLAIYARERRLAPQTPLPKPMPGHINLHDLDRTLSATEKGHSKFPPLVTDSQRWNREQLEIIATRSQADTPTQIRAALALDYARRSIINDPMCVTEPEALEQRALQYAYDAAPIPSYTSNPEV